MREVAATIPNMSTPRDRHFLRAAFAKMSGLIRREQPEDILQAKWPDDLAARSVLNRAAVTSASTQTPQWAGVLAASSFGAYLDTLGPASAASKLIQKGTRIDLTGEYGLTYPARSGPPTIIPWIAEGLPIPVNARNLAAIPIQPRKCAVVLVWSRELDRRSNARRIFEAMLAEDMAATLDRIYFSDDAASAAGHAGLMAGVTPIAASTAGGSAAMAADIGAVLGAVAGSGSSGQLAVAMSVRNAAMLGVYQPTLAQGSVAILPTSALTDAEIVGLDAGALVHGTDMAPDFDTSESASLHMSDAPTSLNPGTMASPITSLFQEGKVAMRLIFDVAFAARRTGAVSWISDANWASAP